MDRFGGEFGAFGASQESHEDDCESAYDDGAHSNPPPSPVGQDERRMQVRAYNHWSSLLGEQNLPHIEDLEPEFLGDFGPYSVLFDFSTGSTTPTLQFIGNELSKECRELDPIETLQEIPAGSLLSKIADNYLKVVQAQGPVTFDAESPNAQGQTVAYRGILLPYSSDHDTIDFVYAVVNWKEVADAQTADALLEEIDRAMDYGMTAIDEEPVVEAEPAPTADIVHFDRFVRAEENVEEAAVEADCDPWASDENILELRGVDSTGAGAFGDLPSPSFGQNVHEAADEVDKFEANDPAIYDVAYSQPEEAVTEESHQPYEAALPKRNRLTDALGNPIGGAASAPEEEEAPAPGGITTAADYGLPEWDEDEPEEEDVDDLVNPLANIDLNSRLLSLVNAGTRGKKTVDLATLSDTPEPEEAEEADAGKLFRPKAPSVDSLLSPEPYTEEDEVEEAFEAYDFAETADEIAEEPACEYTFDDTAETFEEPVEREVEDSESVADIANFEPPLTEAVEPQTFENTPLELSEAVVEEERVYIEPSAEAFEEPLELGEEFEMVEAVDEAEPVAEIEPQPENGPADMPVAAEPIVEEPAVADFEEPLAIAKTDEESAVVAVEEFAEMAEAPEPAQEIALTEPEQSVEAAEPESLTGLLAAVRDLTEAARTTEDASRRALYEAVGRAFDVSIKAVIASEHHARAPEDVIEHFPLDQVARTGPDMALVMVRRHANGDTEVLGEVPHDSILMESAQRKLASQ